MMNNDNYKISNPFTGSPETVPFQQGIGYTIKARYLTPRRHEVRAGIITALLSLAIVMAILEWVFERKNPQPEIHMLQEFLKWAIPAAIIYFLPWWKKTTLIQVTPQDFQLQTLTGWKSYDQGNISFYIAHHQKAQAEQEREDKINMDRYISGKKPKHSGVGKLFRNSFTVWMVYFGQRIAICHIYDPTEVKPRDMIDRLTAVNDLITQKEFIDYWTDLGGCPFTEGVKKQQYRKTQNKQSKGNNQSQENPQDKAEGMSYEEALRLFDLDDVGLTFEMLKKKVRSFRSKFHPDKSEGSTPIMQQINEAYEVIRKHKGW